MKRVGLMVLLSIAAVLGADKDKKFSPGPALSYPGHQTFDNITIAAVPFTSDDEQASAFGKANPYRLGILPVLVIIKNDTGKALRLDLQAEFIDAHNRHIEAMPPADVVLFDGSRKDSWKTGTGPSSPLPVPLPRKKKNGPLHVPEIEGLAFSAHLLPPGESVHGFFYFENANEPGAKIYLTGIKDAASGRDYLYFEVPMQ